MKPISILFVEDNQNLLENLSEYFSGDSYLVDFANNGLTALHLLANHDYDVVVLDLMLPGVSGIEICRKIRNELKRDVPIIMLTALDTIDDKISGFEAGTNDYLCKPFDMRELELRIRSLCRTTQHEPHIFRADHLTFNTSSLAVSDEQGVRLSLSGLNALLFEALIKAYPNYVDYETISTSLWGVPDVNEHTIRTHIYTLRKVLKNTFGRSMIRGIYGRGYQLDPDES
jgi:DNA-binding response OmpR family regulator